MSAPMPYRVVRVERNARTKVADYIVHSDTEGHLATAKNERNAARIARATNNHDKLVEALKSMIKAYWPKNSDGTYGDGLPDPIVIKEARAALRAAGVEDVP